MTLSETIELIEPTKTRVQGMVRSIDQYRNCDPKAIADGSYAQVLYALTDDRTDILVLWDFAVAAAREAEALKREIAELREAAKFAVAALETLQGYEADLGDELLDDYELGRIEDSRHSPSFRIRVGHIRRLARALLSKESAEQGGSASSSSGEQP